MVKEDESLGKDGGANPMMLPMPRLLRFGFTFYSNI
jgi:hypothetical protein